MGPRLSSWRRAAMTAAAMLLAVTGLAVMQTPAGAAVACQVTYAKQWDNGSGFGANITINNLGDAVNPWRLTYTWPGNQTVQQGWNGTWSQSGQNVTVVAPPWAGALNSGQSVQIGFNGQVSGTNTNPTSFSLNGTVCNGGPSPSPSPSPSQQALIVSPTSVSVPEGGTATYSVRLQSQPTSNVTVTTTAGSGDSNLTATSGTSLTFTSSNWNTPQNVTLAAAQDSDSTNGSRTFTVASSGLTSVNVTATEADDDGTQTQALVVSSTAVTVPEGGTATYTVRLQAAPSGNVTVTNTAGSGDTNITVSSGASLTFTTSNWQTPQTVTLAAAQDSDQTAGTRPITVASSGLTSVTVTATEGDDDIVNPGRVDNPYAGATGYVNPDWSASAASEPGGSAVANTSTAIWLDRIAAITSGSAGNNSKGLRDHLDLAVQQDAANGSAPLTIQVVIYNLPNRDCSALASNGELKVAQNGLNRYKTEYIDPIASIMADPAYRNLRIVAIIEIDSLPNLVTNLNLAACQEAKNSGAYEQGVAYALSKLYAIPNVYNYVDAGHHGWLGWDTNFGP
ncbi:glycoside hydrolase family 6 protein, partial [Herbidospora cretacea]|uniref:glycoside hydrolase family 6 protein n=1 Tax=Herbidospora cretacea TaxID=28444 RepID=UPI0018CC28C8